MAGYWGGAARWLAGAGTMAPAGLFREPELAAARQTQHAAFGPVLDHPQSSRAGQVAGTDHARERAAPQLAAAVIMQLG